MSIQMDKFEKRHIHTFYVRENMGNGDKIVTGTRILTVVYKFVHVDGKDHILFAACMFRADKDSEYWTKKQHRKTALGRLGKSPNHVVFESYETRKKRHNDIRKAVYNLGCSFPRLQLIV